MPWSNHAGAIVVRTRPVSRRQVHRPNQRTSQPTAITVNGLRAMATPSSACARAWIALSDPHPGQNVPVSASHGHVG